jgi:transcriptional regulator with XRE-family HTH domain
MVMIREFAQHVKQFVMLLVLVMHLRGERLREAREHRHLSQRQLAELCELGENQIHRYESGKTEPSASTLAIIANALNVSTDYLVGLIDYPRGHLGELLTPDERKVVDAYNAGDNATLLEIIAARVRQMAAPNTD